MKVVLTGSTGFIGSEVLKQCLECASIESVVVLSRRNLPACMTDGQSKLKVLIMNDFTMYSQDVLRELTGTDACIWSLGKALVASDEEARRMSLDYTLAATQALSDSFTRQYGQKLRFIYLSGRIAERDQAKRLWYMEAHRRIRGRLENELIAFAECHRDSFETYIVKPSMVLPKANTLSNMILSSLIATVELDVLARAMVKIALEGSTKQTFENSDIIIRAAA